MRLVKIFMVLIVSAFVLASCGQKTALIAPNELNKDKATEAPKQQTDPEANPEANNDGGFLLD